MNSKNSNISSSWTITQSLDKINLVRSNKYVALSNRNIYYTWKNIKKSCKNSNSVYSRNSLTKTKD